MPVSVVQLGKISPVIIAGSARFLPEKGVPHNRFGCPKPVVELPCPLKMMEVFGTQVCQVFF